MCDEELGPDIRRLVHARLMFAVGAEGNIQAADQRRVLIVVLAVAVEVGHLLVVGSIGIVQPMIAVEVEARLAHSRRLRRPRESRRIARRAGDDEREDPEQSAQREVPHALSISCHRYAGIARRLRHIAYR